MSEKILGWQFDEAKDFLNFVFENQNKSFLWLFENWATKSSRQPFSVRNYFYKLCKFLKQNKDFCAKLGLSSQNLNTLFSKHFNKDDEVWLLTQILPTKNQKSVRSACLNLACGDAFKMVRYQNKFRNLVKRKKDLVQNVMEKLVKQKIAIRNPYEKQNIISISQNNLSQSDLQGLFMGLVRLVKNDLNQKLELKSKNEKQELNTKLRQTTTDLKAEQNKVQKLEKDFQILKEQYAIMSKNLKIEQQQNVFRIKTLKNFLESKNLQKLKEFLSELENHENKLKI